MAHRDGGVALLQQDRDGLADDIAAADHDRMGTGERNAVAVEHGEYAEGGTRDQPRVAKQQAAKIQRMQRVHVLRRFDRLGHGLWRDLLRERKLNQDSVDAVVAVEPIDQVEELLLARRFRQQVFGGRGTDPRAGALLALDVGAARGIVSDENDRELRGAPSRGDDGRDFLRHLVAQGLGQREPIDDDGFDLLGHGYAALLLDLPPSFEPPLEGLASPLVELVEEAEEEEEPDDDEEAEEESELELELPPPSSLELLLDFLPPLP